MKTHTPIYRQIEFHETYFKVNYIEDLSLQLFTSFFIHPVNQDQQRRLFTDNEFQGARVITLNFLNTRHVTNLIKEDIGDVRKRL